MSTGFPPPPARIAGASARSAAAVAVYRSTSQRREIRGVQMRGGVSVVTDPDERRAAAKAYAARFHLGKLFAGALRRSRLYRFRPTLGAPHRQFAPLRVQVRAVFVGRLSSLRRVAQPANRPIGRSLASRPVAAPPSVRCARRRPSSGAALHRAVAMDVSPGVVMASAPCAAPQSTAHCGVWPVRNP